MSERVLIQQMDTCWFGVCSYDVIFQQVFELWCHKYRHHDRNTTFVMKFTNLVLYFFHNSWWRPNLQPNFGNHTHLERFNKILCISKSFGSRGGGIEILTMIGVQICQFLAKSDNRTNAYSFCSSKLINNECLVYINVHSLDFPQIIYTTKIVQFHIS